MSSDRITRPCRRTALLGLVALAGCGFTPVYAPGGAGTILQDAVAFTAPETVAGYALRQRLVDRLGLAAAPRFDLETTITTSQTPATITPDGDTTRFNLIGQSTWALTDRATGQSQSGTVETFASYSATGSTVATQTAEADAERRLSVALADLIATQLIFAGETLK